MLTRDSLTFLQSPRGASLLNDLAGEDLDDAHTLPLLTRLRSEYSPDQAAAALTMARLRHRAAAKFGDDARRMLFTDDALQQASHPAVRRYRAGDFAGLRVIDAGCGIGADSLAFARAGAHVLGLDIDPLRVALAQHNAAVLGLDDRARFQVADVREGLPAGYDAVFFDPARRDDRGRRLHDVQQYIPPLSLVHEWQHIPRISVKLSPAVDRAQVAAYGGRLAFISVAGDLKEAVLHLGDAVAGGMQATRINDAGIHHMQRPPDDPEPEVAIAAPGGWLLEPDPAILRAGLVRHLAADLGATLLDPTIAYLTADQRPASVWVRAWQILDWLPFHLKKLRAYLRQHDVGSVTIKKRGFPMTPEALNARLKLKHGTQSRTLALTRYDGQPVVIICADMAP